MRKKRENYTAQEKVFILKRFLVDRAAVSDLCDEYNLQPTVFYRWQKGFFENGASAFEKNSASQKKARQKRIEQLESKLQIRNEVLSELMERIRLASTTWGLSVVPVQRGLESPPYSFERGNPLKDDSPLSENHSSRSSPFTALTSSMVTEPLPT